MDSIVDRIAPEHTAVRVALWRALHLLLDEKPYIIKDDLGAQIVGEANWQARPDMEPSFSKSMRASIVGRARFIEDLVESEYALGTRQYVILGAGIDTFAQRNPELLKNLSVYEVDRPGPQEWKVERLKVLGLPIPPNLSFVPVNFEEQLWWDELIKAGLDLNKPVLIVSTGVSMYLTKEANQKTLEHLSKLPAGSTFAMTFLLTLDLLPEQERNILSFVMDKAKESGTPFQSLFAPDEIIEMAQRAGFNDTKTVSARDIYNLYFKERKDNLNAGNAEAFLVARTD